MDRYDSEISHEKVTGVEGFDVYYFKFTYGSAAYARRQGEKEDEGVYIYVEQAETDNVEALLLEAIENIKW